MTRGRCQFCKHGHELAKTRRRYSKSGQSYCYACKIERAFKIDFIEIEKLWSKQSAACAICKNKFDLSINFFQIDHDHKTNKVRGLLCKLCNMGLGSFKDSTNSLLSAVLYLKQNK